MIDNRFLEDVISYLKNNEVEYCFSEEQLICIKKLAFFNKISFIYDYHYRWDNSIDYITLSPIKFTQKRFNGKICVERKDVYRLSEHIELNPLGKEE